MALVWTSAGTNWKAWTLDICYQRASTPASSDKTVGHHYQIIIYLHLNHLISLSLINLPALTTLPTLFSIFSWLSIKLLLIWKSVFTSKFIDVCPPSKFIYVWLLSKFIYVCKFCFFSLLICIYPWCVNLNRSDQVPALCTAWGRWLWRGSCLWRRDWRTAGASAARVVKCAAGVERGMCGRWSILAQLCLSALSEPFCLCWRSNAVSAPAYYLSPYIKCAGRGWRVSTQECSPSSICYCCASVKPPSLT